MSKCRQCNLEILDETERCPLCDSVLEHTIEVENMYPNVGVQTRKWVFLSRVYYKSEKDVFRYYFYRITTNIINI